MYHEECIAAFLEQKKALGWTIERLSNESGVSVCTINRVFAGQDVRISSFMAAVEALGLDLNLHVYNAA